MHEIMEKQFAILKLYLPLRSQIMDALEDKDLNFKPEHLSSISEECIQIGEWQGAYLGGFKKFAQDFEYRNDDDGRRTSVAKLRAWYEGMDADIVAAVEGMTDEDVENRKINRGGWEASVEWSLRIWQECLIIFYTKMLLYFKLMEKKVPEGLTQWLE